MNILLSILVETIQKYSINYDAENISDIKTGAMFNVPTASPLILFLFILVREFGNQKYYVIHNDIEEVETEDVSLEDFDDEDSEEQTGEDNSLITIINDTWILENQELLQEWGVYLESASNVDHDIKNTMVISSLQEIASSDFTSVMSSRLGRFVSPSYRDDIEYISPQYLYLTDIEDYTTYREVVKILAEMGFKNSLVYCNKVIYREQYSSYNNQKLVESFIGNIQEKSYKVIDESSEFVRSLYSRINTITYDTLLDTYNRIINDPHKLFLVSDFDVPNQLISVLALAYCTHKKQAVFITSYHSRLYDNDCCSLMSANYGYLDSKINALLNQYQTGTFSVLMENDRPRLVKCKSLDLGISFRITDAESLMSLIKFDGDSAKILMPSVGVPDFVKIVTEKDLDVYETITIDGEKSYRYSYSNIVAYLQREYGSMDLERLESLIYAVLRSCEQVLLDYSRICTLCDILVVKDAKTGKTYLGIGEIKPVLKCDLYHLGAVSRVVRDYRVTPSFIDAYCILDIKALAPYILKAEQLTPGYGEAMQLRVVDYRITKEYLIKMALYNLATSVSSESAQYQNIKDPDVHQINFRVADKHNTLMRDRFLGFQSQYITSYGLRTLTADQSPINIYGSINKKCMRGKYMNLYTQAFRHKPILEGDKNG